MKRYLINNSNNNNKKAVLYRYEDLEKRVSSREVCSRAEIIFDKKNIKKESVFLSFFLSFLLSFFLSFFFWFLLKREDLKRDFNLKKKDFAC